MAPAAVVELPLATPTTASSAPSGCGTGSPTTAASSRSSRCPGVKPSPSATTPISARSTVSARLRPGLRVDLASAYAHRVCRVDGMDCADCAQTIERAVSRVDGRHATSRSASRPRRCGVEYRPSVVRPERIAAQVRPARLPGRGLGEPAAPAETLSAGRPVSARRASPRRCSPLALAVDFLTGCHAPCRFYAAAILAGGLPLARSGLAALVATRRPDINLLMAIAAVGAAAIGAWLEASLVVVLFAVGELLESRAVDRTRRELAGLVSLTPETARVRRRAAGGGLPVRRGRGAGRRGGRR